MVMTGTYPCISSPALGWTCPTGMFEFLGAHIVKTEGGTGSPMH